MEPRHVKPLPVERLAEMPTHRLLAYRDRLLGLEDTTVGSDWSEDELSRLDGDLLYFKEDPRWQVLYDAVKAELSRQMQRPTGSSLESPSAVAILPAPQDPRAPGGAAAPAGASPNRPSPRSHEHPLGSPANSSQ